MTQSIKVPFEGTELTLRIPDSWQLLGELHPRPAARLEDVPGSLNALLRQPSAGEPLGDLTGKRIVIAVDDISRPTPTHLFFPLVLEHLRSLGASPDCIRVLFGLGIHRAMTEEEVRKKLGVEDLAAIHWSNHDARSTEENVELGTTSRGTYVAVNRHLVQADLIVTLGAIEPHLLLGFGGGLKMIVPGLAHERTIAENHMQGVTPDKFNYVGADTSPMRLDLEEAAGMLGKPVFIVNAIMNEKLEICRFVCGDPVEAHRKGIETVRLISEQRIDELADVAIVMSNPMNADLRQGMKSIGNVEQGVKEGGLIVGLLECRHGIGDVAVPPKTLPHTVLRTLLRVLGKGRILWFVDKVKKGAGVEERFLAHFSMQVTRKLELLVYSRRLPQGVGKRLGLLRQFDDAQAMLDAAAHVAPWNAKVHVYPHGGATYPVLKPS